MTTPDPDGPSEPDYDFDHLTEKQRDVLGQIAMNCDLGHHPWTLAVLLKKGLIEEHVEERRDRLGTFCVKRYSVPIHVHVRWCQWCSEHYSEED